MHTRLHLPPQGKCLIYDLADFGIPEIPYFAAQNQPFTTSHVPLHTHLERVEITHMLRGERVYRVEGKDYHLHCDDIFITWPHEMHSSGLYLHERGVRFWMQTVIPKPGKRFLGFSASRMAPLLSAIWAMRRRHFKADPAMRDIYARMIVICQNGPTDLGVLELSSLMCQWFLLLVESAGRTSEDEITPDIGKALQLMEEEFDRPPSIEKLAEAACLSESRFKGKFRQQMGMPPGEDLLRKRIERSTELLREGKLGITEIALELGFSSAQHFSSTFKKFFCLSPRAWLKHRGDEQDPDTIDPKATLCPWIDHEGMHGYIFNRDGNK